MAFRDSINDLMFRFYERFKQNNNRLPVSVDADINVGDVQIGTVKQGGVDEGAEPWKVKDEELEQKIDALKQSIESGVQLKGSRVEEQLTHQNAVNNVLTFSAPVEVVEIYHEESSWQTFIVNGLTLTVPPGGYRTPVGGTPNMQVTIPSGVACIVGRLV